MTASVIEPGTRLAGRYRLEERVAEGGSTLWKAIDEILARAVAVRTFDPGFPRVAEVVTSARAASRLTDPRLTQVFDADDSGENAYVVSEWVAGETLEQMLAKAPLEPGRAATLLYEAAEALAAAHSAGLAHLCLSPRDLVWTTGGTVKVLGVATDAVLSECQADEPGPADARGLGSMLYAALTAHWPGAPAASDLPAAPTTDDDAPQAPRRVQAGIPQSVDIIVCRSLGLDVPGQEPITSPAEFAAALRGVPRTPLPLFAGLGTAPPAPPRRGPSVTRPDAAARTGATRQHRSSPPRRSTHTAQHRSTPPPSTTRTVAQHTESRRPGNRALLGVAAAALTVIVGLGAWAVASGGSDDKPRTPAQSGAPTPTASPTPVELTPVGASALEDPIGGRRDSSIHNNAEAVLKGRSGEWHSQSYASGDFGRYSRGFGVVLDMGKPVEVSSVIVRTPVAGAPLHLRVGDARTLDALKKRGEAQSQSGAFRIKAEPGTRGQYVMVWFTTPIPPPYKARLTGITVYGPPAS
ncbi:hypothetical protein [Actinomadura flavalba]|uniref:hypothetical protein n=1 Tax=Actinomadura flavalba TaxID=1120938 RepID=UPI00036819EE|nr:hypothetical protein [Actinomadura flavalba]